MMMSTRPAMLIAFARRRWLTTVASLLVLLGVASPVPAQNQLLPTAKIAETYFGADAPWFERYIPFLEIDDPEMEQVYYYRWKVYRAHIREIGQQGTTVMEFLDEVRWAKKPYTDLNDSTSFHLLEGRWLRNPAVVNSLIDHMYAGGGNDRHYTESIAAASDAAALVSGDQTVLLRNFDDMRRIYNAWDDHFDRKLNLYWTEPIADATEYTIASIDASGAGFQGHASTDQKLNGFKLGFGFRPSINTYQFGNAMAISHIAERAGFPDVAADYAARAERTRDATVTLLWNERLNHFTDRYERSTAFVKEGESIRGRELVGYLPWFYELTPKDGAGASRYNVAWKHLLSAEELLGEAGLRTVEPTYARYMVQYRYAADGRRECQWNGPSWPFQTSQVLTGLANLLEDYPAQDAIDRNDYLRLLRLYTRQHFLAPGHLDLQEDYDPDKGGPIVGLERSHHYLHSTYVDLILSGLLGVRPRSDNILEISPLLPDKAADGARTIHFFAVQHIAYHGHDVTVVYDDKGSRYRLGKGLSVFVDGQRASGPGPLKRTLIELRPTPRTDAAAGQDMPEDLAVNVGVPNGPVASASSSISPQAIQQANDGRLWFFPENPNGWTPAAERSGSQAWWAVQLPGTRNIGSVEVYFFGDGNHFLAPRSFRIQYRAGDDWVDVPNQTRIPGRVLANGENLITFKQIATDGLRLLLPGSPGGRSIRLIEFEAFEKPRFAEGERGQR
jgi:hypothetical protein